METDEIINKTIDRISELTEDDFHGYRSEIWNTIAFALEEQDKITRKEQDRDTRHACAEAVCECGHYPAIEIVDKCHAACMNVKAV